MEPTADTIRQYMKAAHTMLKFAGFKRFGKVQSAPAPRTGNKVFIYEHPRVKGQIWLSSNLDWTYYEMQAAQVFNQPRLVKVGGSHRLTDLRETLRRTFGK